MCARYVSKAALDAALTEARTASAVNTEGSLPGAGRGRRLLSIGAARYK